MTFNISPYIIDVFIDSIEILIFLSIFDEAINKISKKLYRCLSRYFNNIDVYMNKYRAVITGDIMGSSAYTGEERKALDDMLDTILAELFNAKEDRKDIYRGDSFQVETDAVTALRKTIQLRTYLRSKSNGATDAYVAIGIGDVSYQAASVRNSDGEAYQLSGRALDSLQKGINMQLKTSWEDWNGLFNAVAVLCDSIISNFTANQAEAIYYSLFKDKTQTEIAKELGKYQSTISARLKGAHFDALKNAIENLEMVIKNKMLK